MKARIVNARPEYAPPAFAEPPTTGFVYLAGSVAPPSGPPFVRRDRRRTALLALLKSAAAELGRDPDVASATVYRAVLVPPVGAAAGRAARFDVAVLVETTTPDAPARVQGTAAYRRMTAALGEAASNVLELSARCARMIAPVDRRRQGLFLFNHFVADDSESALEVWEHLAGWYVAETGLDNSMLLCPTGDADFVMVNHARWDKSLPAFAVEQFRKPTFRSYVRANLRENGVTAMPVLYRLA